MCFLGWGIGGLEGLEREDVRPVRGRIRGRSGSFCPVAEAYTCEGSHHDGQAERASPTFLEGRWCCGGWSRRSWSRELESHLVIQWDLSWICSGPGSHVWDTGSGGLGFLVQELWNSSAGTRRGGRSSILRQHQVQYMSGRKMSASLDCHIQTKIIQKPNNNITGLGWM